MELEVDGVLSWFYDSFLFFVRGRIIRGNKARMYLFKFVKDIIDGVDAN